MPDKSVELVEGLILKPGIHGRRTYSVRAKRALVELSKEPGVSVAGLALAHGINANLLRRWMTQYSDESGAAAGRKNQQRAALLPVTTSLPTAVCAPSSGDSCIEITFRTATIRVRGMVNVQALGAVLDCLTSRV